MSIIVKLLNESQYIASKFNPKIGTRFETWGKITDLDFYLGNETNHTINKLEDLKEVLNNVDHNSYNINVIWGNTEINSYNLYDLCEYDRDNGTCTNLKDIIKNKKNIFKSIW